MGNWDFLGMAGRVFALGVGAFESDYFTKSTLKTMVSITLKSKLEWWRTIPLAYF